MDQRLGRAIFSMFLKLPSAGKAVIIAAVLATGCTQAPPEKAPEDIEKARQDHIKMMQREAGGATLPGQQRQ